MQNLSQALETLRQQQPSFSQASDNVVADVRSEENPHGNLSPNLVDAMDRCCGDGQEVEGVAREHRFLDQPLLHRRAPTPASVKRVMAKRFFITYQVLEGVGAADEAEIDAWMDELAVGSHRIPEEDLAGRTGAPGEPCWWTFEEADHPTPGDGRVYVAELALGWVQCRQAERDGGVAEVALDGEAVEDFFKPTSLEGFGPDTPFRPELTGADHGRTVPPFPELRGRPELVGTSHAYEEILEPGTEVEVAVLPFDSR